MIPRLPHNQWKFPFHVHVKTPDKQRIETYRNTRQHYIADALSNVRSMRARELRMVREASVTHRPRNENWIYIETDGLTYHGSLEALERMTAAIKNSFGDQLERFKEYP